MVLAVIVTLVAVVVVVVAVAVAAAGMEAVLLQLLVLLLLLLPPLLLLLLLLITTTTTTTTITTPIKGFGWSASTAASSFSPGLMELRWFLLLSILCFQMEGDFLWAQPRGSQVPRPMQRNHDHDDETVSANPRVGDRSTSVLVVSSETKFTGKGPPPMESKS